MTPGTKFTKCQSDAETKSADLLHREKMLDALNMTAITLLSRKDDAFEEAMSEGVGLISGIADFDRMSVFRNSGKSGALRLSQIYRWNRTSGATEPLAELRDTSYAALFPRWEKILAAGDSISGPARLMPEAGLLGRYGCVTVLAVPMFTDDRFWGFVFFANLREEKCFNSYEADILHSASFMFANAIIRNEKAKKINEAKERAKLMLDASPLAIRLWDAEHNLTECNEAAVRLFGVKDKKEYIDRYFELAPEYQPDGLPTRDSVAAGIAEAFEKGRHCLEVMYRTSDGSLLPTETTLVRVPYGDDYVVASYSRDLREHKKMMSEIERRDKLLSAGHRTSFILFNTTGDEDVNVSLTKSLELLGQCVGANRAYIMQNGTENGVPHLTCMSSWADGTESWKTELTPGDRFPWGLDREWDNRFLRGQCINGPVGELSEPVQGFFAPLGAKSALVIPVFVKESFWGLAGFCDCIHERAFVDDEVSILRSMGIMMAAAVNRSEQAANIREAHNRIKLLTNATPLSFSLWDRNIRNIETNDTAVRLFGLNDQREYLDRFFELSPKYQPDGRLSTAKAEELVRGAFEDGYRRFEWLHQKPDGTPIPTEVSLVRLAYGDDFVVAGYTRDLREHKQMMAAIENRDYLLQTVNHTADMLLRAEPDDFAGALTRCMGMMARAVSASHVRIVKNNPENGKLNRTQLYEWNEWKERGPKSGEARETHETHETRETHQKISRIESTYAASGVSYEDTTPWVTKVLLRGECANGLTSGMPLAEREWFGAMGILSILLVPVFIHGEFWGFVGFYNCESERLFTENEESAMRSGSLLLVNAILRNESALSMRETSARLEVALDDARDANNAKSSFLAHMSHEIRTPLNAVVGLTELALDEEGLGEELEDKLEKIHSSGMTILSIVNDILDISKIESGKFEIYETQYDTPSLINDGVTLNIVRIGEKPITFSLYVDENLPGLLYGDDLRIRQIFNNLLSNAFKYTNAGTVQWRIGFEREGDGVWLVSAIQDTGIGMKPEGVKKLFSDYNQVDAKTNRRVEGTGLGLAITKRLVEMMGGTIEVESEYGKGSTFRVRLRQAFVSDAPIGKTVAENLMGMRYTLSKRNKARKFRRVDLSYARVLVVDDIVTNLDVVRGMMKPYNIKVDCATGGPQAIAMIRTGIPRYDAVFMDHMMPEMDGIEATRVIREEIGSDYARNVPVIALTANALVGNDELFLKRGFQDFISKPIDMLRLDAVLRRWVRDKQLEGRAEAQAEQGERGGGGEGSPLENAAINGIDKKKALEHFGGDEAVLIDVLRSYAGGTGKILANLAEYLAAGDMKNYAIAVHGIKGSSYSIYARETGMAAERLENAAKEGRYGDVKDGHAAFAALAESLIDEIGKALDEIDASADGLKPSAAAPDPAVLRELRDACEAFDMDGVDAAMEKLEAFRYESGEDLVGMLREKVSDMAFKEIAAMSIFGLKTILVIDASGAVLRNMKSHLSEKYDVLLANSAAAAAKCLAANKPDLILLDDEMPYPGADTGFPCSVIYLTSLTRDGDPALIVKAVDDFFKERG